LARYGDQLSVEDGKVLSQLLALDDNDLMDLLIARKDSVAGLERRCSLTPSKKFYKG
jgi:antitoxin CptB